MNNMHKDNLFLKKLKCDINLKSKTRNKQKYKHTSFNFKLLFKFHFKEIIHAITFLRNTFLYFDAFSGLETTRSGAGGA